MTPELSPEMRQALDAAPDGPVELIDPTTNRAYVLVSVELFRRVQSAVSGEGSTSDEMAFLLADLAAEDWEDAANYEAPPS